MSYIAVQLVIGNVHHVSPGVFTSGVLFIWNKVIKLRKTLKHDTSKRTKNWELGKHLR